MLEIICYKASDQTISSSGHGDSGSWKGRSGDGDGGDLRRSGEDDASARASLGVDDDSGES